MVHIDWAGLSKTAKKLGNEGTNVVLLESTDHDLDVLDAALPADDREGPANGGWFVGPRGRMLLVEGLEADVHPWLERLAAALGARGVEGTLTGAPVSVPPAWARKTSAMRSYNAIVGLRPLAREQKTGPTAISEQVLERSLQAGMDWLTQAAAAKVMAFPNLQAHLWVPAVAAKQLMADEVRRTGEAVANSFDQQRTEIRRAKSARGGAVLELGQASHDVPWRETVDALKAALLAMPLGDVSIAMITHRGWTDVSNEGLKDGDAVHGQAYARNPQFWHELTLEPCGVQILTQGHLDRAHDLSGWHVTRLDESHHLVEARDVGPWFANPPRSFERLDDELMNAARADFGDMRLTTGRARSLGIDVRMSVT